MVGVVSPLAQLLEAQGPLTGDETDALSRLETRSRRVEAGRDLAREHGQPAELSIVQDGLLCRYVVLPDGRRQILAFHLPGDACDLEALLAPVDFTTAALAPTKVVCVGLGKLRALIELHPGVGQKLWRLTARDAAVARVWMTGLGRRSAYSRMAHLFCELIKRSGAADDVGRVQCEFSVTQSDIADATGLSIVHVNRVLQRFRAEGVAQHRAKRLMVHRWAHLCEAASFDANYLSIRPISGSKPADKREIPTINRPRAERPNDQPPAL